MIEWPYFIRFLIALAGLVTFVYLLVTVQFREVLRPADWLTRLRWLIFISLSVTIATLMPQVAYLLLLSFGHDNQTLRQVITLISGVTFISTTVLTVLIFKYRKRG